ncbi:MAG: hypothetical protein FWD51_01355 [Betaproteobacteria bacterium]|nr:hypothetical protein [Betaproteobacteria bacterium]
MPKNFTDFPEAAGSLEQRVAALEEGGTGGGSSQIAEAPKDGKIYGRKDGAWNEVESTGGGTLPLGNITHRLLEYGDDFSFAFESLPYDVEAPESTLNISLACNDFIEVGNDPQTLQLYGWPYLGNYGNNGDCCLENLNPDKIWLAVYGEYWSYCEAVMENASLTGNPETGIEVTASFLATDYENRQARIAISGPFDISNGASFDLEIMPVSGSGMRVYPYSLDIGIDEHTEQRHGAALVAELKHPLGPVDEVKVQGKLGLAIFNDPNAFLQFPDVDVRLTAAGYDPCATITLEAPALYLNETFRFPVTLENDRTRVVVHGEDIAGIMGGGSDGSDGGGVDIDPELVKMVNDMIPLVLQITYALKREENPLKQEDVT